ncbi:uncharacterized protein LOC110244750 [Exaiptasia diaphana]|uniref:Uncharacterized protein n=1 Tax=Exaiptasia diaphana TaxID=2652724 RepID=A0A913XMD6_EXADI|nr:uncharacterized protein LOC110244750 [Exaiptasia diaphana]
MKVQLVLSVCGFLISLSSIWSLECRMRYKFGNYTFPQESMSCGNDSQVQCVTTSYDLPNTQGILFSGCRLCDQEGICNSLESGHNATNCQVTCCNTDYCNDSGAENNGTSEASKDEGKKIIKKQKMVEKRKKHHKH